MARTWTNATKAGVAYGLAAFAIGFLLGAVRVLRVAPAFGDLAATAIELPLMLTSCWYLSNWVVRCDIGGWRLDDLYVHISATLSHVAHTSF